MWNTRISQRREWDFILIIGKMISSFSVVDYAQSKAEISTLEDKNNEIRHRLDLKEKPSGTNKTGHLIERSSKSFLMLKLNNETPNTDLTIPKIL